MYEAPVKDLNFVIKNLINLEELNKISDYQDFSDDLVDAILEEAGKIGSEVLDPCNLSGDHEGSKRLDDGEVKTPKGYKATNVEGFVAIDQVGKAVKLVDRLEFSQNNFNAAKAWDK